MTDAEEQANIQRYMAEKWGLTTIAWGQKAARGEWGRSAGQPAPKVSSPAADNVGSLEATAVQALMFGSNSCMKFAPIAPPPEAPSPTHAGPSSPPRASSPTPRKANMDVDKRPTWTWTKADMDVDPVGAPVHRGRHAGAPSPRGEEARQQAAAEGLTLQVSNNKAGYKDVAINVGRSRPFEAKAWRGGDKVHLGSFATAEEAALCVARESAFKNHDGPVPPPRAGSVIDPALNEAVLQQAAAEGLTLQSSWGTTGFKGVTVNGGSYQAHVVREGKKVHLGAFVTADEAALCVARNSLPPGSTPGPDDMVPGPEGASGLHSPSWGKRKRDEWKPEEDLQIMQMVSQGLKWGTIAKELPGDRTGDSVRCRWQRIDATGFDGVGGSKSASDDLGLEAAAMALVGAASCPAIAADDFATKAAATLWAAGASTAHAGSVVSLRAEEAIEVEAVAGETVVLAVTNQPRKNHPTPCPQKVAGYESPVEEAEGIRLHLSRYSTTGYRGVCFDKGRFKAEHSLHGKKTNLGRFDTALQAAIGYARHVQEVEVDGHGRTLHTGWDRRSSYDAHVVRAEKAAAAMERFVEKAAAAEARVAEKEAQKAAAAEARAAERAANVEARAAEKAAAFMARHAEKEAVKEKLRAEKEAAKAAAKEARDKEREAAHMRALERAAEQAASRQHADVANVISVANDGQPPLPLPPPRPPAPQCASPGTSTSGMTSGMTSGTTSGMTSGMASGQPGSPAFQQMNVVIPDKVRPGMPFQVNTPFGAMRATCPIGWGPGMQMLLNVPLPPTPPPKAPPAPRSLFDLGR